MDFAIGDRMIGETYPTYFIADIAANHDGELQRALELIELAARAGADAAKFQNFTAPGIVSRRGFAKLGGKLGHQAQWDSSVVDVYAQASIPKEWTPALAEACRDNGIAYFSAPYDLESIAHLDPYVPAFKVGSGDVDWLESIEAMAATEKPVLLATGAADIQTVVKAVQTLQRVGVPYSVMQCNTNYTGTSENLGYANLRVLETYKLWFPDAVLGLSDHTAGHVAVLGAIALGARVVEKHFTDDTSRVGPDHAFSMDFAAWRAMVHAARDLERALGTPRKKIEMNESDTVIVQRRCLRSARPLQAGHLLTRDDISVLRPAPSGSIPPSDLDLVIGKRLLTDLPADEELQWDMLGL